MSTAIWRARLQRIVATRGRLLRGESYKWNAIRNAIADPRILASFVDGSTLPPGFGRFVDERIVEYPFLASYLHRGAAARVLDAGSALNHAAILHAPSFARHKLTICTLAPEPDCFHSLGIDYVFGDLRHTFFADEVFDVVACVSTLEHVGMDNTRFYTDDASFRENDAAAYRSVVRELRRVVRTGGTALVTVPCGRAADLGWLRVFGAHEIEGIVEAFEPASHEVAYFRQTEAGWQRQPTFAAIADATYSSAFVDQNVYRYDPRRPGAEAVALLTLTR